MALPTTTTQRGLGWEHQKVRRALLRDLIEGTPCDHCGKPMYLIQKLEADHEIPRAHGGTRATRLLHASCNQAKGGALSRKAKRWVL